MMVSCMKSYYVITTVTIVLYALSMIFATPRLWVCAYCLVIPLGLTGKLSKAMLINEYASLVREMRSCQRNYEITRSDYWLAKAKSYECQVDAATLEIMSGELQLPISF